MAGRVEFGDDADAPGIGVSEYLDEVRMRIESVAGGFVAAVRSDAVCGL